MSILDDSPFAALAKRVDNLQHENRSLKATILVYEQELKNVKNVLWSLEERLEARKGAPDDVTLTQQGLL